MSPNALERTSELQLTELCKEWKQILDLGKGQNISKQVLSSLK